MPALLHFFTSVVFAQSLFPVIALQVDDAAPVEEAPVEEPAIEEEEESVAAPRIERPEDAIDEDVAPQPDPQWIEQRQLDRVPAVTLEEPAQPTAADRELAGALNMRNRVRDIHRGFGIAAWISMAGTLALGAIQLHDEYGPFVESEADTPCDRGTAIFPDFCRPELPWLHMSAGIITGTLYYTAATMSFFFMPDPLHVEDDPGPAGERLRIHKALRWFHTVTMLLTSALGIVTANLPQDVATFEVRQALAWTHMALGSATFVFLSAAAFVMF